MQIIQYPINGHIVTIQTNDISESNLKSLAQHIFSIECPAATESEKKEAENKIVNIAPVKKNISIDTQPISNYTKQRMNEAENHSFNDKYK